MALTVAQPVKLISMIPKATCLQVLQAEEIAGPGCPIHPPKAAQPKDPFEDKLKLWEAMAAVQYRTDGVADGWDSDEPDTETSEQKYIKVWEDCRISPICGQLASPRNSC